MSRALQKDTAILCAATELFIKLGLDRVSVDDIAKEAKVSKPTIYSRYETKEKLYVAVLIRECEQQIGKMFANKREGQSLDDYIYDIAHEYLSFITDPKYVNLLKNAMYYADRFEEIGESFMTHGPMKGKQKLADALSIEMEAGKVKSVEPSYAADFILSRAKSQAFFCGLLGKKDVDYPSVIENEARAIASEFVQLFGTTA